jgi:hypothetical protein
MQVYISDEEAEFINNSPELKKQYSSRMKQKEDKITIIPEICMHELNFHFMASKMKEVSITFVSVIQLAKVFNILPDDSRDKNNKKQILENWSNISARVLVIPCLDLFAWRVKYLIQTGGMLKHHETILKKCNTLDWLHSVVQSENELKDNKITIYPSSNGINNMLQKNLYMQAIGEYMLKTYIFSTSESFTKEALASLTFPFDSTNEEEESYCALCGDGGDLIGCDKCNDYFHYHDEECVTNNLKDTAETAIQNEVFLCPHWYYFINNYIILYY